MTTPLYNTSNIPVDVASVAELVGLPPLPEGSPVYLLAQRLFYVQCYSLPPGIVPSLNGSTGAIQSVSTPSIYWVQLGLLLGSLASGGVRRVRGVSLVDFVDINAFVVADIAGSNDGINYLAGDGLLLFNQNFDGATPKNPEQNGPWIVGTVVAGVAPLSRPLWWQNGLIVQTGSVQIRTGAEGVVYGNTDWVPMGRQDASGQVLAPTNTITVGVDDPGVYPQALTMLLEFTNGATGIYVPVLSDASFVGVTKYRNTANAATVSYKAFLTAGNLDFSGRIDIAALTAAGATNAAENGSAFVSLVNQQWLNPAPP